jgi:polyketide synthase PksM
LPEQHELDDVVARWPLAAASVHLLSRTGPRLADVLAGRADPVGLLFDGGRFEATRAVYGESPFARYDNTLAARAVAAWLAARPTNSRAAGLPAAPTHVPDARPARVLEVGAGTGGTTAAVLPLLDPQHTQYVYTDLSAGFLNEAAERFAAYPFVEYRVFDLEREPAAQRLAGPFDVILAANVLHATTDLAQTLTRLRHLLADDGLLLLVELVDLAPWVELTFGLTDGWWRFADHGLRPHSPLLSRAAWCDLLATTGFAPAALDQVTAGGDEARGEDLTTTGSPSGQTILAAKATPAENTTTHELKPPARESAGVAHAAVSARASEVVRRLFARFLRLAPDELGETTNFMDLGFDSILALQIQRALAQETGLDLPTTLLLEHASVARLSEHLVARYAQPLAARWGLAATTSTSRDDSAVGAATRSASVATNIMAGDPAPRAEVSAAAISGGAESVSAAASAGMGTSSGVSAIAVVGLALRFPGAETPEAFWQLLATGRDAVGPLPAQRQPLMLGDSRGLPPAGWLTDVAGFDAPLFQISPREAELLDPQQRLFLEVAWEALERSGLAPTGLAGTATGVFVGVGSGDYAHLATAAGRQQEPHFHSGTTASMIAARTSYLLNLHGPSLTVDTACSSGLVAVHLACQSLRSGECQLAIAGGANLILSAGSTQVVLGTGTLSADGRCKTFDQRADGFARGEGIAAVVLKPLAAAQRDGDPIWGVIRGSATNHDGHAKAGLTAPSPQAQAECLRAALTQAGLSARELDLVEAHGTGTSLGDPLEVEGLLRAFAPDNVPEGGCALGSVKSNIGHLEAAAGLAGLVKALLALRARQLPATLHVEEPNRLLRLESSPFWINDRLRPWPASDHPRRAAVSALGLGGANAHLILEEPPAGSAKLRPCALGETGHGAQLFTISARTKPALRALAERYLQWIDNNSEADLGDLCHTANVARTRWIQSWTAAVSTSAELRENLIAFLRGETTSESSISDHASIAEYQPVRQPRIGLLFTSTAVPADIGNQLQQFVPFQNAIEDLDNISRAELNRPIDQILRETLPAGVTEDAERLRMRRFALQIGLAATWRAWGLSPLAIAGIGEGEIAAEYVSETLSPRRALQLVFEGAKLEGLAGLQRSAIRVFTTRARIDRIAGPGGEVTTATLGPEECVAIGAGLTIRDLRKRLEAAGIKVQELLESAGGEAATRDDSTATALGEFERAGVDVVLEVGLADECLEPQRAAWLASGREWISSLRSGSTSEVRQQLLTALGRLYFRGFEVDWHQFYQFSAWRRLALPTYPFEHERYWVEAAHATAVAQIDQPRSMDSQASSRAAADARYALHPLLDECLSFDGADPGSCAS